ncbi:MAG TPA: FecR domain-containing protein [Thermodesulfobacteriota bacterium]|nr:FecR domain-containing protein [Thermodesulfobacteriota bacterium]
MRDGLSKFWIASLTIFVLGLAAAHTHAQEPEPIGIVTAARGQVTVVGEDGVSEAVEEGARVYLGDRFETGEDSGVKILFNDDTLISLGANTTYEINEFVYTPNTRRSLSNILRGKLKGIIQTFEGEESNVEFATPKGVIGIKGTIVYIDADRGIFFVLEGKGRVRGVTEEVELLSGEFTIIGPDGNPSLPKPITPELRKELEEVTLVLEEAPPRDSLYKEDYPGKEPPPAVPPEGMVTTIGDVPTGQPVDLLPGVNPDDEAPVDVIINP